jgi:putative ABC transport system permease protein
MILKFVLRSLWKRPFLTFIKIFGLALSLSGFLLIVLFLKNELTYESLNKNAGRIYRFTIRYMPSPVERHFARVLNTDYVPKMADYFPEIENYVRLAPVRGGLVKHNEEFIMINEAFECDSIFFRVFPADLLVGNPQNILNDPCSMVISESFAERVFGKTNPVGQILTIPAGQYYANNTDYTIKGVMRDFPQNSHFHPEFITTPADKSVFNGWAWVYFLLSENADPLKITSGFKDFFAAHIKGDPSQIKNEAYLQKITDIHLHSNKQREIEANSNIYVIYTLAIAALILLITGLSNYSNLHIGMAGFSEKYLFISRVSGSSSGTIMKYFLTEQILIVAASGVLSGFCLVFADMIIQKYFNLKLFAGSTILILSVVILFIIILVLAGILPLMYQRMSELKTSTQFRNNVWTGRKGLSKSIIVLQFTISTILIIAVLVIRMQTVFALKSGMDSGNNNLICFRDVHSDIQKKFPVFKEELLKFSSVEMVSAMFAPPGGEANDVFEFRMEGYIADPENSADSYIGVFPCDYSFAGIFGLEFLSGNNFSETNKDNEGSGEYIINESAMKRLNYTDPAEITEKEFHLITNISGIEVPTGKIIGVVKDFHLTGIKKKVEPLVMFKREDLWLLNFVVSYRPGMKTQALSDIESVWRKMFPGYPFRYEYVNSMYKDVYRSEVLQSGLLTIFTLVSLFICSMGLLGMTLLSTQKRTKEIGLRKINGASSGKLMIMLNWDLVRWILLAFAIAVPFAFLAMHKWLENFAYKIDLSWWIFAVAGLTATLIALLTVSLQSWKTARRNPVEALRYE